MNKARSLLAVLLSAVSLALGLGLATAGPASASSCSYGAIGTSSFYGPPGSATVWLGTADVPARCGEVRAEAWAQGNPTRPVFSGWVKNPGIDATAQIPGSWHNPTLLKASEWRQHADGTHCQRREFYPAVRSWTACPAAVHTTAQVQQHWTYAKLYAALAPGYGPFLICAWNHPVGKDRMGMWYGNRMTNVLAEPCDISREWTIVDLGNDINGVPEVNIQAYADGFSLATTKHCVWLTRHADVNTEGTLWKMYIHDGDLYLANNRCSGVDKNGLPRYNKDAATNNREQNHWFIADRNHPQKGDYLVMWLKIPPSAAVHTTALVTRHQTYP